MNLLCLNTGLFDCHFYLCLDDLRCSNLEIRRHLRTTLCEQFITREIHTIPRLPFDLVPEFLELRRQIDLLVEDDRFSVPPILNRQSAAGTAANGFNLRTIGCHFFRKLQCPRLQITPQPRLYLS